MKLFAKTFTGGDSLEWSFTITDDEGNELARGEKRRGEDTGMLYMRAGVKSPTAPEILDAIRMTFYVFDDSYTV